MLSLESVLYDFIIIFLNLTITKILKSKLYYVNFTNEEIKVQREF